MRISKYNEDLMHDKAELMVQVTYCERENMQRSEVRGRGVNEGEGGSGEWEMEIDSDRSIDGRE